MIPNSMIEAFKIALSNGEYNLFIGSGASLDSTNGIEVPVIYRPTFVNPLVLGRVPALRSYGALSGRKRFKR